MILIEEQRTNYVLNSYKPSSQYFDKSLESLCVTYRKGFLFYTRHAIWEVWKWRYIKSGVRLQAPFTLISIRAHCVQVEQGEFPTSYIATGNTPITRGADDITITLGEMFPTYTKERMDNEKTR